MRDRRKRTTDGCKSRSASSHGTSQRPERTRWLHMAMQAGTTAGQRQPAPAVSISRFLVSAVGRRRAKWVQKLLLLATESPALNLGCPRCECILDADFRDFCAPKSSQFLRRTRALSFRFLRLPGGRKSESVSARKPGTRFLISGQGGDAEVDPVSAAKSTRQFP